MDWGLGKTIPNTTKSCIWLRILWSSSIQPLWESINCTKNQRPFSVHMFCFAWNIWDQIRHLTSFPPQPSPAEILAPTPRSHPWGKITPPLFFDRQSKKCQIYMNPWPVGLVFSTGRGGPVGILPTWDLLRGPRRPTTPPWPKHRDRRLDFGKKNPPKDDSPFLLFFCRRKVFNRSSPVQDFDSSNQGAPTSFSLKKRRGGV